jgi:hypothetical protein
MNRHIKPEELEEKEPEDKTKLLSAYRPRHVTFDREYIRTSEQTPDNSEVRISDGFLCCPVCSDSNSPDVSTYLHHMAVTVYDRAEDTEETVRTRVTSGKGSISVIPSCHARNPSSRRGGVVIEFWCEHCGGTYELCFAQHKGMTIVKWREWAAY